MQYSKSSANSNIKQTGSFFIEGNLKLVGVENEKLYFFDADRVRVKIIKVIDGETKTVKLSDDLETSNNGKNSDQKENLIVRVDKLERVHLLKRKLGKIVSFDESGKLIAEVKVDSKIQTIENFYPFETEKSYCMVDRKNCLVHFLDQIKKNKGHRLGLIAIKYAENNI